MSYELTTDKLQDISVRVVSKFMTKQASLTDAISEEAKSLELNPEQIKRVIESSNTIAYLRQLETATDRSFEFPVATYNEVMGKMVLPDSSTSYVGKVEPKVEPALAKTAFVISSVSEQEKVAMLRKETLRVRQTLTKMAEDSVGMTMQLEQIASKVQKDPFAFEKLASVASEEDLPMLVALCSLEKSAATSGSVFSKQELADATSLNTMFKEAKTMISNKNQAGAFVKQATEVLEKIAMKSVHDPKIERDWLNPEGKFHKGPTASGEMPKVEPGFIRKGVNSAVGAPVELAGNIAGKAVKGVGKGVIGAVKGVGKGISAAVNGTGGGGAAGIAKKTIGAKLEGAANLGGAVLAGASVSHEHPVWDSLH